MSETELIDWLRSRLAKDLPPGTIGVGPDDCAHVPVANFERLAITTDTIHEGTHFTADTPAFDIGWKAAAVNISDLAASGCRPCWATVAACIRKGAGDPFARQLAEGLVQCAEAYDMRIIGGDTTSGDCCTTITVTAIGAPIANQPLLRSTAKAGDILVVTGALGGSSLGRHLHPTPRLHEVTKILKLAAPHAALDISDGLALDLHRLARESKVGARLDAAAIPVSPDAATLAKSSGRTPLSHALRDGEDFELLFTLSPDDWPRLSDTWTDNTDLAPLTAIGTITSGPEIVIVSPDGVVSPLPAEGYSHAF